MKQIVGKFYTVYDKNVIVIPAEWGIDEKDVRIWLTYCRVTFTHVIETK